jgi:hypothetical protein
MMNRSCSADVPLKAKKKYPKKKTSKACGIEYTPPKIVPRSDKGIPTTTVNILYPSFIPAK